MTKEIKKDFIIIAICATIYAVSFLPALSSYAVILCAVAAVISSREMIKEGFSGLLHFDFGEETLMLIAVLAAFAIGEYHEGAMVALLFSLGEELEDLAVSKSEKNIAALADIRPDTASVIKCDTVSVTKAEDVHAGTDIFVKVGERVPIDIEITVETAVADLSALTGESMPQTLEKGDILKAGAIVLASPVTGKTICEYGDSAAARIIDMVKNASAKKGQTEKFITKFSRIYTPTVVALAAVLFLSAVYIFDLSFDESAHRALVFLVSSCPCALVLSVPIAYFAGIGAASRKGVIIKGSEYCEKLAKAVNAVFDKTGTLTSGILSVSEIKSFGEHDENEILRFAASAEQYSTHPVAVCVTEKARSLNLDLYELSRVNEISGEGISAIIENNSVSCGNKKLMDDLGITVQKDLNAGLYISFNGEVIGTVSFEDTVIPGTAETIKKLHNVGIKNIVMLTGDRKETAEKISHSLDLDACYSSLMPEDKVTKTEEIKKSGITIFTGDGINDAPVLSAADVGAAIGMGTDAAVESADIVLMNKGISPLYDAITISRKILKCVKENITFIMTVKIIVLILGALGYSPVWLAVFADVGVCLISLLWSLRLLKA